MKTFLRFLLVGAALLPGLLAVAATNAEAATLEVLNPRGEIPPPPINAPSERITDLSGKKIGIYWIGKAGGDNFWDGVEELLNEKYPTAQTVRYRGPFDLGAERAAQIVKEVDTLFYGVGD